MHEPGAGQPAGTAQAVDGGPRSLPAPAVFSTEALPRGRQFEAWCDHYAAIVDTRRDAAARHPFPARQEVWDLGGLALSQARAPAVWFARQGPALRRRPLEHWALVLAKDGPTTLETDRGTATVPPGVPYVWALGQGIAGRRTARDWLVLFLPRGRFADLAPLLDAAHGRPLPGTSGLLVGDLVAALERRLPTVTSTEAFGLAEAVRALLRPALVGDGPGGAAASAQHLGRLERARRIVAARLGEPGLDPERLARLCGLSRSALYRLLEPEGGVAAYIRDRRLRAAWAALVDTGDRRPVRTIAEALAFADAASFSRAFRAAFEVSPRDVRAAARLGTPLLLPGAEIGTQRQAVGRPAASRPPPER